MISGFTAGSASDVPEHIKTCDRMDSGTTNSEQANATVACAKPYKRQRKIKGT